MYNRRQQLCDPTGLEHGVCRNVYEIYFSAAAYLLDQSEQPGTSYGRKSDCVVKTDLDPPHAVYRGPS